jgi:hypothetical protein
MPIHDWTKVKAGIFHDFHHGWLSALARELNYGVLPTDSYALIEQLTSGFELDHISNGDTSEDEADEFTSRTVPGPRTRFMDTGGLIPIPKKSSAITVRRARGDRLLAVVEVVLPDVRTARVDLRSAVDRAVELMAKGVQQLVVNLHPPSFLESSGIHEATWERLGHAPTALPQDKPLTLAAYVCGQDVTAYVEPVAVGAILPDMPLFFTPDTYVNVPLEKTYMTAWEGVPRRWRKVIEPRSG